MMQFVTVMACASLLWSASPEPQSATEVLERHVAASQARQGDVLSVATSGTVRLPTERLAGRFSSLVKTDGSGSFEQDIRSVGVVSMNWTEDAGEITTPIEGTRALTASELQLQRLVSSGDVREVLRQAQTASDDNGSVALEHKGRVALNRVQCDHVSAVFDDLELRYWFTANTGLLRRIEQWNVGATASLMVAADFRDYRDFDGLMLPTRTRIVTADVPAITLTTAAEIEWATDTAAPDPQQELEP